MIKAAHTYGREERLKSRKRIELLFKEGKRIGIPPLMFIYRMHEGAVLQAGVGVRSKQFRKAVDRNRIKRLLRECWRTQKSTLRDLVSTRQRGLDVFILFTGTEIPSHADLFQKTGDGIVKIIERYEAGNKTST